MVFIAIALIVSLIIFALSFPKSAEDLSIKEHFTNINLDKEELFYMPYFCYAFEY